MNSGKLLDDFNVIFAIVVNQIYIRKKVFLALYSSPELGRPLPSVLYICAPIPLEVSHIYLHSLSPGHFSALYPHT